MRPGPSVLRGDRGQIRCARSRGAAGKCPWTPLSWHSSDPRELGRQVGRLRGDVGGQRSMGAEDPESHGRDAHMGHPSLQGCSHDGPQVPMLTQFPCLAERPHREPGHGPVPGGGDVQGRQLRAAAGDAAVLRAEVGHQKLGQARTALTPGPPPCLKHGPGGLGRATALPTP